MEMHTSAKSNDRFTRRNTLQSAAAMTDDRLGMLLRLHLSTEILLDDYLELERTGGVKEFVGPGRAFGDKLAFAVAFGLPLPLAKVCKLLNSMRNAVAHNTQTDVTPNDVRMFARTVDLLKVVNPNFKLLVNSEGGSQVTEQRGPTYKDVGDNLDLVLAFFAFDDEFVRWLKFRSDQLQLARLLMIPGKCADISEVQTR